MEKERANRSVSFYVSSGSPTSCGLPRASSRGFSHIFVTATVSLVALLVVVVWQIEGVVHERDKTTSYVASQEVSTTSPDDTSAIESSLLYPKSGTTPIGSAVLDGLVAKYFSLQEQGLYTTEVAEKTAEKMAEGLIAPMTYHTYSATDISTSADTSYARMLAYRGDLQVSLMPLLKNKEPEYEIFAYYVSTKDKKNLEKLQVAAQNYRAAAQATASVVPPKDALNQHLGILNAMEAFATALDTLVTNADDPFASVVALRTYNQSEAHVLTSFASLAKYYREKQS